jgi:hypothetical protein
MDTITDKELDDLETEKLVSRMDEALSAPYWQRRGNDILNLNVRSIYESAVVRKFEPDFQRKVAYKTFGFLLQLQYTVFSISAHFFQLPEHDRDEAQQLYYAARNQWTAVSSRVAFEYFMQLTYMLGTGGDFPAGKSAMKKYKKWMKERDNSYTYFSITAARAKEFDRTRRTPEVHAATKLARCILLMSATDIDNDNLHLFNTLQNQWQFILDIVNEREPNGWAASGGVDGDKEWYDLWKSGDHDAIAAEIDKMFSNSEGE